MQLHVKRPRLFAGLASLLTAIGLSVAFVPAASAQVTTPSNTIENFGGNGSTFTFNGFNGGSSNIAVVQPGSANTTSETLTMPYIETGAIYTAPIGIEGASSPFLGCPYGFGYYAGSDTATSYFTAPTTAGIYYITAFLGMQFTCQDSWHSSAGDHVGVLVVTSFDSVCSLAQSYTSTTDPSVGAGLCDKLAAANAASQRGNTNAEQNILNAFDNLVAAQTSTDQAVKALTSDQAETLTTLVYYLTHSA